MKKYKIYWIELVNIPYDIDTENEDELKESLKDFLNDLPNPKITGIIMGDIAEIECCDSFEVQKDENLEDVIKNQYENVYYDYAFCVLDEKQNQIFDDTLKNINNVK